MQAFGYFFEKNATYQKKTRLCIYSAKCGRTFGGTLLFLIVGRTEVQLFLIYANYSLLFVQNDQKMIQKKGESCLPPFNNY